MATAVANAAGSVVGWVNGRRAWVRLVVWLLLFWLLLPLLIVHRTGGSRGGLISAGGLLLAFLIVGAVGGEDPSDAEPLAALDDQQEAADATPVPSDGQPSPTSPSPREPSQSDESPTAVAASPDATASQAPAPAARADGTPAVYAGAAARTIDGDTFELPDGTRVRIAIVDTPEVSGGADACGTEAEEFTRGFLTGEQIVVYRPASGPATDPYGRMLGEVVRDDGASLNVALVAAGLGTIDEAYTSEDSDLTARLRDAASSAATPPCAEPEPAVAGTDSGSSVAGSITIATIRYDGPGSDVDPGDSEYVELRNDGDADVDLTGWTLIDAKDNSVRVPSGFMVPAGSTFRVYTGPGDSVPSSRYFAGRGQAYLNNDGDTVRLLDENGEIVDTYSY